LERKKKSSKMMTAGVATKNFSLKSSTLTHRPTILVVGKMDPNVRYFAIGGSAKKDKKPEDPVPELVSASWVQEQVRFGRVRVLDCSWGPTGNWQLEYAKKRIPGALYVEYDKWADWSSDLPHMNPKPIPYEKCMEEIGLTHKDHIVLYDRSGQFVASARTWWTMKTYGHHKVSILNGGLQAWEKERYQVETTPPPPPRPKVRGRCKSSMHRELIADMRTVNQLAEGRGQIVDARPAGRFNGIDPEPRGNCKMGHIPGSINIPFEEILVPLNGGPEKTFASKEQIEEIFAKKGVKIDDQIILTSGVGFTAAVLALGLTVSGRNKWKLYDGSWAEYGILVKPPERPYVPLT